MNYAEVLKRAATRVKAWRDAYNIVALWTLSPEGLVLTARRGVRQVERHVSWVQIETAAFPAAHIESVERECFDNLRNI